MPAHDALVIAAVTKEIEEHSDALASIVAVAARRDALSVRADEPLSLEAAVDRALEIAPQVGVRSANFDAMQALAVSAGRLPDPELVVGIDNLPVTGADAYSRTRDFMTMRKVGVMQEFPAASKRACNASSPAPRLASPKLSSSKRAWQLRARSHRRGSDARLPKLR